MAQLCFYFQLHQPYRLRNFSVFDLTESEKNYFVDDRNTNQAIFSKVAQKSYVPMLSLLYELTQEVPKFIFALSCSGIFLEQALAFEPRVIELIQQLVSTSQVELLSETYYHSLSSLYSLDEFVSQVRQHTRLIQKLFSVTPKVFRNTELIYSNDIAAKVAKLGFIGILTEGVERYLHGRSRAQLFISHSKPAIPVLLKHAQLSDDVAFRFSDKNWFEHPLTAEKYLYWLDSFLPGELINLFMDFETFGEHQWEDTGIFNFFKTVVHEASKRPDQTFVKPSVVAALPYLEILQHQQHLSPNPSTIYPTYDVPEPISWADVDRDLTAWRGNSLQHDTLRLIYSLEDKVLSSNDQKLIEDWRRLQTSDHFYYMCVKWSADGDVHKYFSPYDSPFEAYNRFSAVVADMESRLCHEHSS